MFFINCGFTYSHFMPISVLLRFITDGIFHSTGQIISVSKNNEQDNNIKQNPV